MTALDVPFHGEVVHLAVVPMDDETLTYAVRYLIEVAGAYGRAKKWMPSPGGYAIGIARAIARARAAGKGAWEARKTEDDRLRAVWRLMPRSRPLGDVATACDAIAFAATRVDGQRVDFRDRLDPTVRAGNRAVLSAVLGHPVLGHASAACGPCDAIRHGDWNLVLRETKTDPCIVEDLVVELAMVDWLPAPLESLLPEPIADSSDWEPLGWRDLGLWNKRVAA